LVQLFEHESGKTTIKGIELLAKVGLHKEVFFPAAWARYPDAKTETLRLVPHASRIPELEQEYRKMREMIFGKALAFKDPIGLLGIMEAEINKP